MFLGVVRVGVLLGTVGAMAAPAGAAPSLGPALFVGPVRVHHGYRLHLADFNCVRHGSLAAVDFARDYPGVEEGHIVAPAKSRCRAHGLSSASLSAKLGKFGAVALVFHKRGKIRRQLDRGCTGKGAEIQRGTATGTLRLAIDPKFFGRISRVRLPAALEGPIHERCRAPADSSRTITLTGFTGGAIIGAIQHPSGRSLVVIDALGRLGKQVLTTDSVEFAGGPSLFDVSPTLDSARLGGRAPIAKGELTFTRDAACQTDPHGGGGQLQGLLRLHFDTGRTVVLRGGDADLTVGNDTSSCGEGSPFSPDLPDLAPQAPPYVTTRSVSTPTMNPALTISRPTSRYP